MVGAYPQADLQEKHKVYVKNKKQDGTAEYWKLHKALYRLKQARYERYQKLQEIMKECGMTQCISDQGTFYKIDLIIRTHVDDFLAIGTLEELKKAGNTIQQYVKLELKGKPEKMLGIEMK